MEPPHFENNTHHIIPRPSASVRMSERPIPFPPRGETRPWDAYTLVKRLGTGSFGHVYQAVHKPTSEPVAVKLISLEPPPPPPGSTHAGSQMQEISEIQREVASLAQCRSCPQVTRYYGSFVCKYTLWVVMELLDGGSCLSLLQRGGPLEERVIASVCHELVSGLDYLHAQGIIHRDIKAANVLLSRDGQVKLADFGVAAQLAHRGSRRNTLVGTPYWMAPEVIRQSEYNASADIWSLGITALELATGHPPLSEHHPVRALFLIPKGNPPRLDRQGGRFSAEFANFVDRCLAKEPRDRATARQLRSHPFVHHAPGLSAVRQTLDERGRAPESNNAGLPPSLEPSVLDTSGFSDWLFDDSQDSSSSADRSAIAAERAAAIDRLDGKHRRPEPDSAGAERHFSPAKRVVIDAAESEAPSLPVPTEPALAETPRTPRARPHSLEPPSSARSSRTPSAWATPRSRPPSRLQPRVQAALEQLAYSAGHQAHEGDSASSLVYQLRSNLSQLGRHNPELLDQFVELLGGSPQGGLPSFPDSPPPAAASRLSLLLYERWLEGLRGRWNSLHAQR